MATILRQGAVKAAWVIVAVLAVYIPLRFFFIDYGTLLFKPVGLERVASLAFRFGTDVLAAVLVGCLLVARGWRGLRLQWVDYAVLLFVLISVLSMWVNHSSPLRFGATMRGLFLLYVVGFCVARLPVDEQWLRRTMWGSLASLTLVIFVGLLEALGWPEPRDWIESMTGINAGRIMSLLKNPNTLASYLVVMFFLGAWLLPKRRLMWLAAILPVLYYTFSRSGWLGFLFAFVCAWPILPWKKWAKIFGIGVLVTGLIVAVNLTVGPPLAKLGFKGQPSGNPIHRVIKTLSEREIGNSMFNGRLFILRIAFDTIKERPLFGYGSGTFGGGGTVIQELAKRYRMPAEIYSDSQYSRIIIETGVLGFLSFALIHLALLWQAWKAAGRARYVGIAMIVGIGVMDAFNNLWELQQVMFPFWMMAALSFLRQDGWSLEGRTEPAKPGIG
ncbi:MAG: O-antigen ligase family protein [Alicyclobacillaceae bacterium]|nr:O-antigen ligase family protein [Alicyclobacillaceae bacterium]